MWVDVGHAASTARLLAASAVVGLMAAFTVASAAPINTQYTAVGALMPSAVAEAVLPPTASVADMQTREAQYTRTLWPTHGWATSTPEEQGIDSAALAKAIETIRARHLPVGS